MPAQQYANGGNKQQRYHIVVVITEALGLFAGVNAADQCADYYHNDVGRYGFPKQYNFLKQSGTSYSSDKQ